MTPEREALNDLGLWLGCEATNYVKILAFIESIPEGSAKERLLRHLLTIHQVFKRVVND